MFGVRAQMAKFPLLYWDRRTCFCRGVHAPFPYGRNFGPIAGALLHFKYFSDFRNHVEAAVVDGQHWREGTEYQAYSRRLDGASDLVMTAEVSKRYTGVDDLVALGFVEPIDWTDSESTRPIDRGRGKRLCRRHPGRGERAG